jgi:hypothetical protein
MGGVYVDLPGPLTALSPFQLCFVSASSACSSKWAFAVATNITNFNNKIDRLYAPLISLCNEMSITCSHRLLIVTLALGCTN